MKLLLAPLAALLVVIACAGAEAQAVLSNSQFSVTVNTTSGGISSLKLKNDVYNTDYIWSGDIIGDVATKYRVGAGSWTTGNTSVSSDNRVIVNQAPTKVQFKYDDQFHQRKRHQELQPLRDLCNPRQCAGVDRPVQEQKRFYHRTRGSGAASVLQHRLQHRLDNHHDPARHPPQLHLGRWFLHILRQVERRRAVSGDDTQLRALISSISPTPATPTTTPHTSMHLGRPIPADTSVGLGGCRPRARFWPRRVRQEMKSRTHSSSPGPTTTPPCVRQ